MIGWYQLFILAVIALRIWATPQDKNALSIILVASFVSTLLVHFVTHEITGAWKLAVPGAVETLTIAAMMQWSRNRTGYLQCACLLVAWMTHLLCYLDISAGTNIVYDRYETILLLVAAAQILVCYDTLARCGSGLVAGAAAIRFSGGRRFHPAGGSNSVLPCEAGKITPPSHGTEKIH